MSAEFSANSLGSRGVQYDEIKNCNIYTPSTKKIENFEYDG